MKKEYKLSIDNPCRENWDDFQPTATGGFCSACSKNVIDFTKLSDAEVVALIHQSAGKTCGKFRPEQLNRSLAAFPTTKQARRWSPFKIGLAGLSLILFNKQAMTQPFVQPEIEVEQHVGQSPERSATPAAPMQSMLSGVVVDDGDEPLPGVNVVVKGTNRGTVTDLDGKFQVNAKDGEVLVFSFVGMETKEYEVGDRSDAFIKMKMDLWDLMGSVTIDGVYHTKPNLWARIKAWF